MAPDKKLQPPQSTLYTKQGNDTYCSTAGRRDLSQDSSSLDLQRYLLSLDRGPKTRSLWSVFIQLETDPNHYGFMPKIWITSSRALEFYEPDE